MTNIEHLVDLCEQPSYRDSHGLTWEQRREWASQVLDDIEDVDSFLDKLIEVNEHSTGPVLTEYGYK